MHLHAAVMRAVAAAAGGKGGFSILSQRQRRRDGRQAEGREQDEAEDATHALVAMSVAYFLFAKGEFFTDGLSFAS